MQREYNGDWGLGIGYKFGSAVIKVVAGVI